MRFLMLLTVFALQACKTVNGPDPETLKPAIEAFHRSARWRDFRGAADLIVPERRTAFIKARSVSKDEKDLFITDYQLEDARMADDRQTAEVVSRINWYRLPSVTEISATVTSVYAWRKGQWLLESQDDGPFEDLRPLPDAGVPADGGTADAGR